VLENNMLEEENSAHEEDSNALLKSDMKPILLDFR
jgi:hypothetical protein